MGFFHFFPFSCTRRKISAPLDIQFFPFSEAVKEFPSNGCQLDTKSHSNFDAILMFRKIFFHTGSIIWRHHKASSTWSKTYANRNDDLKNNFFDCGNHVKYSISLHDVVYVIASTYRFPHGSRSIIQISGCDIFSPQWCCTSTKRHMFFFCLWLTTLFGV